MSINVVCPGCKKRYTVSEKFAGQKGPCPHCKTILSIPGIDEQVVVHAPEGAGPKDSAGRAVIQPILREETRFSAQNAAIVGGSVVLVLALALLLRAAEDDARRMLARVGAVVLAPPLVLAGYTFLRNSELEPYRGQDLYIRVAACAAAYAFLWGAYAWIAWVWEVPHFEIWQLLVIGVPAVLAGGFAAYASLDLDYLVGIVHYGLYLIVTVLLSFVASVQVF